ALTNLVYNAVHAMPQGGSLRFETAREDGWATLRVSDTGTGMSGEVLAHLFEPFYTTKGAAGSGLGLFVTYGLVTQHEGTIDVASAPGAGTTFRLRFPAVAPERPRAAESQLLPRAGARVLVVDDEEVVRDVIGSMLRGAGLVVREAADAQSALSAIQAEPFDLVITDLSMPEMSGIDLARVARRAYPRLPFLLLTGWAEGSDLLGA